MKKKLSILLFCVLGALIVLLGVITYINFQSGDKYKKQVLSQAQQKYQNRTMPAKRGTIYDRNGNILATSNKVYNVVLDCKAVNSDEDYLDPTVNALVTIFGLDEGELRTRLTSDKTRESQYQIVKKQVSMDDAARMGEPEKAVSALLMDKRTNTYLVNGHNYQDGRLRIYLPGNGGLLTTVAMMCAGWDGSEGNNPGFPKDGKWNVRWEGLQPLP